MKMTRQQVADLLLRMNEDCSNAQYAEEGGWQDVGIGMTASLILKNISVYNMVYRIKDNAVKEVTLDLTGCWAKTNSTGNYYPINGLSIEKQKIYIVGNWYTIDEFNNDWQLVED